MFNGLLNLFSKKQVEIPEILKTSYPPFARKAVVFLDDARAFFKAKGMDVGIHFAFRTFEEQDGLYAIGRTVRVTEKKVTRARGGQSYHNYGIAIDIVFKINGKWSWDGKLPWAELGAIGKKHGFEWAGDWKEFTEMPHFQMTGGLHHTQLLELYKKGGLKRVWEEFDRLKLAA